MIKDEKNKSVLVSVCVLTYNSSAYVLETLNSIKDQTYPFIELIVSDDSSTDGTLEMCRQWADANSQRFVAVKLLATPENTGIPANCNRAVRAAAGEWIKQIAGDDLLLPDSIENYLCALHEDTQILVGRMQTFYVDGAGKKIETEVLPRWENERFFRLTASAQHRCLLLDAFNFTPAVFIRRTVFERCGDYDEQFRYLEDLPYWLRLTAAGIRFEFLPCITVFYRTCHSSMVFGGDRFFNERFTDCLFAFRKQRVYPEVSIQCIVFYQSEWVERLRYRIIMKCFRNKRTLPATGVYRILSACSLRSWSHYFRRYFYRCFEKTKQKQVPSGHN